MHAEIPAVPVVDASVMDTLRAVAAAVAHPGEDVIGEFVRLFADDSATQMIALDRAAAHGGFVDVARIAHTLKGAAANLGLRRVVAACILVEKSARSGTWDPTLRADLACVIDEANAALARIAGRSPDA